MPTPDLPASTYDIVYADPPWWYYGSGEKMGAAGKEYQLMQTEEICKIPVPEICNNPSALFLWATSSKLPDALQVMKAWGFEFRGIAYVWVKTAKDGRPLAGIGVRPTFTKPTTELVLVGSTNKRGRPFPLLTEAQSQVLHTPRGAHSQKPEAIRERIVELLGDRPRIELFARSVAPGWHGWGLEYPPALAGLAASAP